jgi:hypothetical protein
MLSDGSRLQQQQKEVNL